MTPRQRAFSAYMLSSADEEASVNRALDAYLTAVSEDEATVGAMCRAFAPEVPQTVAGIHYETEWSRLRRKMRAALTALASRDERK